MRFTVRLCTVCTSASLLILLFKLLVWISSSVCVEVSRGLVDELAILHLHGGWGTRLSHNRRCNATSKQYYYTGQYKHLNDLFDFKPNVNYTKLRSPKPCPIKTNPENMLILFGVKSMPKHADIRSAIRETWLSEKYWQFNSARKIQTHHIFLLGTQDSVNLDEEENLFGDILQYDFVESHYNLTVKDHKFFDYIVENCPQVDYVFKGDDDILLVPENLYEHVTRIGDGQNTSELVGCMHKNEMVNRNINSKYYMPRDLVKSDRYPPYFSGAGYLMTANVAFRLAEAKKDLPITPLDDTYIGELIKMINYTDRMVSSTSLCTGVHVVPQNAGGWHMDKDFDNPCFLAGLTMYHRFGEGVTMRDSFMKMRVENLAEQCKEQTAELLKNVKGKWGNEHKKFMLDEWSSLFSNFFALQGQRLVHDPLLLSAQLNTSETEAETSQEFQPELRKMHKKQKVTYYIPMTICLVSFVMMLFFLMIFCASPGDNW